MHTMMSNLYACQHRIHGLLRDGLTLSLLTRFRGDIRSWDLSFEAFWLGLLNFDISASSCSPCLQLEFEWCSEAPSLLACTCDLLAMHTIRGCSFSCVRFWRDNMPQVHSSWTCGGLRNPKIPYFQNSQSGSLCCNVFQERALGKGILETLDFAIAKASNIETLEPCSGLPGLGYAVICRNMQRSGIRNMKEL